MCAFQRPYLHISQQVEYQQYVDDQTYLEMPGTTTPYVIDFNCTSVDQIQPDAVITFLNLEPGSISYKYFMKLGFAFSMQD